MTVTHKGQILTKAVRQGRVLSTAEENLLLFINPTDAKILAKALKKALKIAVFYSDVELSKDDLADLLQLEELAYHVKQVQKGGSHE